MVSSILAMGHHAERTGESKENGEGSRRRSGAEFELRAAEAMMEAVEAYEKGLGRQQ
jgi:hypothetical protein